MYILYIYIYIVLFYILHNIYNMPARNPDKQNLIQQLLIINWSLSIKSFHKSFPYVREINTRTSYPVAQRFCRAALLSYCVTCSQYTGTHQWTLVSLPFPRHPFTTHSPPTAQPPSTSSPPSSPPTSPPTTYPSSTSPPPRLTVVSLSLKHLLNLLP